MERDKLHWEEVRKTWQASVDQDRDRQEKRANVRIRLLLTCSCHKKTNSPIHEFKLLHKSQRAF